MRLVPELVLLAVTALWGTTFVIVKDALADASPVAFLALRFSLAAVAAFGFALAIRGKFPWKPGLLVGVVLFAAYFFQTAGLAEIAPSRSAFLTGLYVVFVPVASRLVLGRWPGRSALIGVALAAAGLLVLTRPDTSGGFSLGDVLTLGCALSYAFHITLTQRFAAGGAGLVAVQMAAVAALSWLLFPIVPHHLQLTPAVGVGVVVCGLFASALAINLQTWGQGRTSAVRAAIIFSLEPAVAALTSFALGREPLSWSTLIGGGLIMAGVVTAELR